MTALPMALPLPGWGHHRQEQEIDNARSEEGVSVIVRMYVPGKIWGTRAPRNEAARTVCHHRPGLSPAPTTRKGLAI